MLFGSKNSLDHEFRSFLDWKTPSKFIEFKFIDEYITTKSHLANLGHNLLLKY